jgi:hypothetical protein
MRLSELVARHPSARLASPADNARILTFFEETPMRTSAFDVRYCRRPDFFRLIRYQADRAHVIVLENERGGIDGLGTVAVRPGWVGGRSTTVGYLGDLRIRFDRQVLPRWRRLFGDLVMRAPEIDELADCTHWFTAVMDDNRLARTALGPKRPGMPLLVPLAPFVMRNLILRLPLTRSRRASRCCDVHRAVEADRGRVAEFFERENRSLPLGFRGELERRLARWEGLSISDFIYATDAKGRIVACVAPWSPSAAKQTLVPYLPAHVRALGRVAAVWPTPAVRLPQAGQPLRILYLTHLTFASRLNGTDRALVFRAMLDRVFDDRLAAEWHCVALCDFRAWELGRALRGFVQETVPITVYEVVAPGRSGAGEGALYAGGPPAFEMAMV